MKYIYFFRCLDAVKIGISTDPYRRLWELNIGLPFDLECLGIMPGDDETERKIHHQFKDKHKRGEWYTLSNDDLSIFDLSQLESREKIITKKTNIESMRSHSPYSHEKLKQYYLERGEKVIKLVNMGITYQKIGEMYGMTRQRISQIVIKYRQQIGEITSG